MTPIKLGSSNKYSWRELICRQRVDAKKWCKQQFGAYAEAYEDEDTINSLKLRTRPAICLGPNERIKANT